MKYTNILFLFFILLISCGKVEELQTLTLISEQIKDTNMSLASIGSVQADGKTFSAVTITITDKALIKNKSVTFDISPVGKFSNGNTTINIALDLDGKAVAYVSSIIVGKATIKAKVDDAVRIGSIDFTNSLPDRVLIESNATIVSSKLPSNTSVLAKLTRSSGTVSEGQIVVFYDSTTTNKSIGTFFNTTKSNISGESTAQYSLQDSTYKGFVYIKGYVNDGAKKILGVNRILIK